MATSAPGNVPMDIPDVEEQARSPESEDCDVLEINIQDDRTRLYFLMIAQSTVNPVIMIETDFLKQLLNHCTTRSNEGIVIRGPSGTGKSSSSLYLWEKLHKLVPFLVCSPQCYSDSVAFISYIKSFCEENKIVEEMSSAFKLSPAMILQEIFTIPVLQERKPVFFVDLCRVTHDQKDLLPLVKVAMMAMTKGWYIVLAYSSGGGWINDRSTSTLSTLQNHLSTLDHIFKHLRSEPFNGTEVKKFIEKFQVDIKALEEKQLEVANNPYLLSCFHHTVSDSSKFEVGVRRFGTRITQLTRRFISTLNDPVYSSTFNDCLMFLEYYRHNIRLSSTQIGRYEQSYLHLEYLTVLEDEDDGARIKLIFPPMYDVIVTELKSRFEKRDSEVVELPFVQGYMFENRFLQCKDLHSLTIYAMEGNSLSVKTFSFSSLISASVQETKPIKDDLRDNEIRHLRQQHPAIDGVCVALSDSQSDSDDGRYLLLLQVSISEYRKHESKGIDIRKQVDPKFEGKFHNGTIAEYYKRLAKVSEDKKVIYVYVSPKELESPSEYTFRQELKSHDTKSSSSTPQYLYGFCRNRDKLIERCAQN